MLLFVLSASMIAQQSPVETVQRALDGLARRDWATLETLVDYQALESLRQDALGMLILTTEQRLAGEKAEGGYDPQEVVIADHLPRVGSQRIKGFRGEPTIRYLASLSPGEFFIEWARAAYGDVPEQDPMREVAGLYRRIIGVVLEKPDTAHVVYRREHRHVENGELKVVLPGRVAVMSVVRTAENWRIRFNDDIGWSIDFSHVVFHDRKVPRYRTTMPPQVGAPEPPPPRQQRTAAGPTPSEVVASAFAAFEARNWEGLSGWVHPAILRSFQQEQISYFVLWLQSRDMREQARQAGTMAFMLAFEDSLPLEAIAQAADLEVPLEGMTLLAVGWLEPGHEFSHGAPDAALAATLQKYAPAYGVALFSGSHRCGFCARAGKGLGHDAPEGSRNLFFQVPGQDAVMVAPELIAHYIAAHGYHPPELFREAVAWRPPLEIEARPSKEAL